jgi:hypothetical protein
MVALPIPVRLESWSPYHDRVRCSSMALKMATTFSVGRDAFGMT